QPRRLSSLSLSFRGSGIWCWRRLRTSTILRSQQVACNGTVGSVAKSHRQSICPIVQSSFGHLLATSDGMRVRTLQMVDLEVISSPDGRTQLQILGEPERCCGAYRTSVNLDFEGRESAESRDTGLAEKRRFGNCRLPSQCQRRTKRN